MFGCRRISHTFKPIEKAGQLVTSWVKEDMMPEDVLVCVGNNGGRASLAASFEKSPQMHSADARAADDK